MTQTITRNDPHRPSVINPDEYEYVAQEVMKCEGLGNIYLIKENRERIQNHMARTGGTYSRHAHGGNCMCCGSVNAIYTTLFYHRPTNSYVRLGSTCAEKLDMGNANDFRAIKAAVKDAREAKVGKQKASAVLHDLGLDRAWKIYTMPNDELLAVGALVRNPWAEHDADWEEKGQYTDESTWEFRTLCDILDKLVRFGSLSEKQTAFVRSLVDRIDNRKKIEAERAVERAAAEDCPEGKVEVEGTVIKIAEHDSYYGVSFKMTVKSDKGWLVWGTVPSSLNRLAKGTRVKFNATVTRSDRDSKFGFFKRPTNAKFV